MTLSDAKTGPRHVLLGEAARELLDGLAETASGEWVFPGKNAEEPLDKHALYGFWLKARDAAGIVADARLHDLRHAHASHAVMNGESLHVAGHLLGHRRATTTAIYAHLDDAALRDAAAQAATVIALTMGHTGPPPPVADQTDDATVPAVRADPLRPDAQSAPQDRRTPLQRGSGGGGPGEESTKRDPASRRRSCLF